MRASMKKYKLLLLFSILLVSSLGISSFSSSVYASGPSDDDTDAETACNADQFLYSVDGKKECLTKESCMDKSGVNPIKASTSGKAGTCASCPAEKVYNSDKMICEEMGSSMDEASIAEIKKAVRSKWSEIVEEDATKLEIETSMTEAAGSDPAMFKATLTVKPELWKLLRDYVTIGKEFDFDGVMKIIPDLKLPTIKAEVAKEIFAIFGELMAATTTPTDPLLKKILADIIGEMPTAVPTESAPDDKLLKYILFKEADSVTIDGTSIDKPTDIDATKLKEYFAKVIVPAKVMLESDSEDFPTDEEENVVVTITYKVGDATTPEPPVAVESMLMEAIPTLKMVDIAAATVDISSEWDTLKMKKAISHPDNCAITEASKAEENAGLPIVQITHEVDLSVIEVGFAAFSLEINTCMPAGDLENTLPKYAALSTADKVKYEMALIARENAFAEKIIMTLTTDATGTIRTLAAATASTPEEMQLENVLKTAITDGVDKALFGTAKLIDASGADIDNTEHTGSAAGDLAKLIFKVKKVKLTEDDIKARLVKRGIPTAEADTEKTKFTGDMLGHKYVIVGMRKLPDNAAYKTYMNRLKVMTTIPAGLNSAAATAAGLDDYVATPATSQNGYTIAYLPDTTATNATYNIPEAKVSTITEPILSAGFGDTLTAHTFHVMALTNMAEALGITSVANKATPDYRALLVMPGPSAFASSAAAQTYAKFLGYGAKLNMAMTGTGKLVGDMEMIATDDKYMTGLDGSKKFHLMHLAESVKMLNPGFTLHDLDHTTVTNAPGTEGKKIVSLFSTASSSPKGLILLLGSVAASL